MIQIKSKTKTPDYKIKETVLFVKENRELPIDEQRPLHILKRNNNWAVVNLERERALRIEKYREIAFLYACSIGKENQRVIVHDQDNTILFEYLIK